MEEPDNWPGLVYHGTLLSVHVSHASVNQRQRNGAVPKHRRSKSPLAAFGGHSRWALRIPFRLNGKKKPRRSGALSACSGVGLLGPWGFRCRLRRCRVRIGRHRSSRRRGSALAAARGFRCRGRGGARSVAHHRKHNKSCNDQGADDSRHDPTGLAAIRDLSSIRGLASMFLRAMSSFGSFIAIGWSSLVYFPWG
jgi:hypothetical protein